MIKTTAFALGALALSSMALVAQQSATPDQQTSPPPSSTHTIAAPSMSTSPAVALSPVQGQLVDNLDTKTAKTGDNVVIKTSSTVKTSDGTEIPKGSKLMGHVAGVKASGQGNENSQIALAFDRAELKSGQTVAIRSEIQSLSPAGSDNAGSASPAMTPAPSGSPSGAAGAPNGTPAGSASATAATQGPSPTGAAPAGAEANPTGAPAVGTVVARTGNIAIRTTAIPGVLLASNEPGQQDPRMAQSSGILLGAKRDVHLDGGTQVIIGVAAAGTSGAGN